MPASMFLWKFSSLLTESFLLYFWHFLCLLPRLPETKVRPGHHPRPQPQSLIMVNGNFISFFDPSSSSLVLLPSLLQVPHSSFHCLNIISMSSK